MLIPTLCALALAAGALASPAKAQDWPRERTIITLGFGPGSGVDLVVRILAEALQAKHNRPFIVENKPGAGGNISMDQVAKAPPDGSVIGAAIYAPVVTNPMMMARMPFDPVKDITPVTVLATTPSAMVASNQLGVKSLKELMDLVKKEPGKYTFASVGVGSTGHLSMEMAAFLAGSRMVHIPFRSTPETVQALLSGSVQVSTIALGLIVEQIRAGSVSGLALTASKRWPTLPDLPTTAEAGMPEMPVDAYTGLFVPSATPAAIVDRIWRDTAEVIAIPAVREKIDRIYYVPGGMPPAEFARLVDGERKTWEPLLKRLGLFKKE
jgi:tripartite-type tricarboxylate transporter receptor subunit TctC